MADFNALEALINANIKKNGVQAITGNILNGILRGMVAALGKGYTIAGSASPATDPGTMTGPLAYIAYTAGTYTHFGGLEVEQGEVAMLIYNEAEWHKEVLFSLAASATIDGNVGTPEVGVSFVDGQLTFDFRNMKGNPGDPAGFGTVNATVDGQRGTPSVSVQSSGPDTAKNFTFAFHNLKGETGVTSVVATVDNTVGTPTCTVSLVGQQLTLAFSGLKGAQGDTGSSVAYPFTIVNNLTTDDATQALSAAMGVQMEGEISQLELKVDDLSTGKYYGYYADESDLPEDATVDGFAYVGSGPTYTIYNCVGGVWTSSGVTVNQSPIGNEQDIDQNAGGKLQFANRVYGVNTSGMGYKILRPDSTFADQVTETDTVFEIRYGFTLSANKTLPTGAVLLFNGGSISGTGVLTFVETTILGNAKITCGIAGTIFGQVHAEWFGMVAGDASFDNGPIIEKVCSAFTSVVIGNGDYYCSSAIDLSNRSLTGFYLYGNLHYTTTGTSNAFLTFSREKEIRIYGTIFGPVQNNTGGSDRSVGILFKDCNGSNVFVNDVRFFYKDVEILGSTDGLGNAYNKYEFGLLVAANILLELKAEDPGWVTSNRISCQRMTSFGGYTTVETAILIDGETPGFSDNIFEKLTIEGVSGSEPIKLYNANNVTFNNIRNEANFATLIYANWAKKIKANATYGSISIRTEKGTFCDFETDYEAGYYEPLCDDIFVPGGSNKKVLFHSTDATKQQVVNYNPLYYTPVGFIAPVNRSAYRFSCSAPFSLTVVYFDNGLTPIARDAEYMPSGIVTFQNSATVGSGYVTSSRATIQTVIFPTFPSGCAYIGYFFNVQSSLSAFNGKSPVFSVPASLLQNMVRSVFTLGPVVQHNKYGTTAQRPTFAENYRQYLVGYEYFDTSLGKPIYASAIANDGTATWVDATGTTV